MGKYESKAKLEMPLAVDAGKLLPAPILDTTPHPPWALLIIPAWMAAPQMYESPR